MPAPLIEKVESLSGYRPLFPPLDAKAGLNPIVYSHVRISLGSKTYSVLSRICPAGLDYSERTNKFAHHVVLDSHELPSGGPAWLLRQPKFMETQWDGQVRSILTGRTPPRGEAPAAVCQSWLKLTGDAGWAGVLAEAAEKDSNQQLFLLFEPGMDLLPLIAEALLLLPPEMRWSVTFSTYSTSLPQGLACAWRGLPRDSTEAANARRLPGALVIDLRDRKRAAGGPLVEVARSGQLPAKNAVPRVPANVLVEMPAMPPPGSISSDPARPGKPAVARVPASAPPLPGIPMPPPVPSLRVPGISPPPSAGFSGKSFILGTGSGVLVAAAAAAALIYFSPELLGLKETATAAPPPTTVNSSEDVKAAAVQEYMVKHTPEVQRAAVDNYMNRHEDRVRLQAAKDYLKDDSNSEATRKEAIEAYRRDNIADVRKDAVRIYLDEEGKRFLERKENFDKVVDLALERNKQAIHEAAATKYQEKNKDQLKQEALKIFLNKPDIQELAREEYLKRHKDAVRADAIKKYTDTHKDEVRTAAIEKHLKENPAPPKKAAPEIQVVNRQISLPEIGQEVILLDNSQENVFQSGISDVQLRILGMPFIIHSANGRDYDVKDENGKNTIKIKLVDKGDANNSSEIATIGVDKERLFFSWSTTKDPDQKKRMTSAREFLRNRVLEVKGGAGAKYHIAFRESESVQAGHPLIRDLVDGLSKCVMNSRFSAHVFSTNRGKDRMLFPIFVGPVDAEVVVAPDGKPVVKLNRPLSLYMRVGDQHVEIARAEEGTLK